MNISTIHNTIFVIVITLLLTCSGCDSALTTEDKELLERLKTDISDLYENGFQRGIDCVKMYGVDFCEKEGKNKLRDTLRSLK